MDLSQATAVATAFPLIGLAEIGDKGQLARLVLVRQGRPVAVLLGASVDFVLLNLVAVLFGSQIVGLSTEPLPSLAIAAFWHWCWCPVLRSPL